MAIHPNKPASQDALRASVISDLMRAQRALPHDSDLAALYLDGALRKLMALAGEQASDFAPQNAESLFALDHQRPGIARRLRLALRAPHAEARLAHCWALIELLNAEVASVGCPHQS